MSERREARAGDGALLVFGVVLASVACAPLRQAAEDVAAFGIALNPSDPARLSVEGVEAVCAAGSIAWIVPVDDDSVVLVDAGFDESGAAIRSALRGRRVRAVLLTHAHPDHRAAAHLFDAPVYVGAGDIERMRGDAPELHIGTLLADALLLPPLPRDVQAVGDGAVVVAGARRFRALAMPGHTPGSIAWQSERALFTGDAALGPRGDVVGPSPSPYSDDEQRAWDSLRLLGLVDVDVILDGHFGVTHVTPSLISRSLQRAGDDDGDVPWGCLPR